MKWCEQDEIGTQDTEPYLAVFSIFSFLILIIIVYTIYQFSKHPIDKQFRIIILTSEILGALWNLTALIKVSFENVYDPATYFGYCFFMNFMTYEHFSKIEKKTPPKKTCIFFRPP